MNWKVFVRKVSRANGGAAPCIYLEELMKNYEKSFRKASFGRDSNLTPSNTSLEHYRETNLFGVKIDVLSIQCFALN
jgi:hypothetical protein